MYPFIIAVYYTNYRIVSTTYKFVCFKLYPLFTNPDPEAMTTP
jgi:hypothetical protein